MGSFVTGVVAGYGLAIPVGPIAVLIVQTGIRCGWACGASAGAGAAFADLTFAVAAVLGGAAIASLIESVEDVFRVFSALVLVAVAVSVFRASRRTRLDVEPTTMRRGEIAGTFAKFFGLTIVNPPTVLYFTAFIVGLGLTDDLSTAQGAAFAAGAFLSSLSWQLLLATTGAVAGTRLPPSAQRITGTAGSLIVLAMAAVILLR
jgi:arginine exporter protein ArgO